jgi:dTDP-3-amino-3,4,6-trideoxy-alpha-D-glucose transaminase
MRLSGPGADSRVPQVPFTALERQHGPIANELHGVFSRLLHTSAFTLGEEVERFEFEFARFCGVKHCVGVSSGTAALALSLRASGIGPGDEVIVPAHTFIASALAVAHVGAEPVLCDVQEGSGLIDPDAARAVIGPRTAAIIGVHLYGQACDVAALRAIAGPAGLLVLEDAAQAHGASTRGQMVGSLANAAAFSFYPTKNLGALGDGGAICTDDSNLTARLRRLRNLGQRTKDQHVELGYNERLDGLQAGLLRVKLAYLESWNAARRRHANRYRELLGGTVQMLEEHPDSQCVYHLFPIRVVGRDALAAKLGLHGIKTGVHYRRPVHLHAAWRGPALRRGDVSRAEAWAAEELSLPMHPYVEAGEITRVAQVIQAELTSALQSRRRRADRAQRSAAPGHARDSRSTVERSKRER